MFYCVTVIKDQHNILRFLWHKDKDITKEKTEYHMNVHIHKIASNSSKIMEVFPTNDMAKDIKLLNLDSGPLPV